MSNEKEIWRRDTPLEGSTSGYYSSVWEGPLLTSLSSLPIVEVDEERWTQLSRMRDFKIWRNVSGLDQTINKHFSSNQ